MAVTVDTLTSRHRVKVTFTADSSEDNILTSRWFNPAGPDTYYADHIIIGADSTGLGDLSIMLKTETGNYTLETTDASNIYPSYIFPINMYLGQGDFIYPILSGDGTDGVGTLFWGEVVYTKDDDE